MFCTVDGKQYEYTETTVFTIQVGKGAKGAYKNRYRFTGQAGKAFFYYESINIGRGYKKRVLMGDKVLHRVKS